MTQKITDIELETIANEFCRTALGVPGSEVALIRERNVRAYNALPEGEFAPIEIEDRSQYVASDVSDTVDGMLPQIMDVFVTDDLAVECQARKPSPEKMQQVLQGQQSPPNGQPQPQGQMGMPTQMMSAQGPDPDKMAEQATGYLNHLFYVRNDGLNILHDWLQDAALQKVGWVKIWAEEETEDNKADYEGQTQDQLAALLQDGAQLKGEPQVDDKGFLSFVIENNHKKMAFKVACVPPHQMRIDVNARWGGPAAAIGEVIQKRRFELEEMGYDLDTISQVGGDDPRYNSEAIAMLGQTRNQNDVEIHESHKLYEYSEIYMQIDADGDGVAEWMQICLINGTLVKAEETDGDPYADICLMPRAHAFFGDCPADRAYSIQKEQTNLARALFDNVMFATNQRTYVNTSVSVDISDVLDNRPGGVIRGKGPMSEAFAPIPTEPIPQTAWQLQEWLEERKENRTGFTRYSAGMNADSLNKTATGVSLITQKADMRLRLMTRFAAQGVRKMFEKLLKLATQHQDQRDWYNVNGTWNSVLPTEWKDQFNIKINVGLGHGTRDQQAQRIMAMVPLQQMGVQAGVVRPEHIANTIQLFAKTNEFKNPDKFCDAQPQGPSQKEQQLMQQMQQMQQQAQQAITALQAKADAKDAELLKANVMLSQANTARFNAETNRMKLGEDAVQAEREFEFDLATAAHDSGVTAIGMVQDANAPQNSNTPSNGDGGYQ